MFASPGETYLGYLVPGTSVLLYVGVEIHTITAVLLDRLVACGTCVGWSVVGYTGALLMPCSQGQQRHQTLTTSHRRCCSVVLWAICSTEMHDIMKTTS